MRKPRALALAATLGATLAGRQPGLSAPRRQTPTFRSNVNAALLDIRVLDRDGAFVRELAKDDFVVEEDGVAQPVSTFELVDLPFTPARFRPSAARRSIPTWPPTRTRRDASTSFCSTTST
jgi:hypothetical protein